ncbi:MAG: polysulfide reductase NrfD [Thermodesulfovibrionales bacterium]|nr:polysulfide reductase NrfD [Thermodesulfovibrionales bacterium]
MKEISVIGANAITYPHLDIWNWTIAVYLFLGGMVAGLMVLGAISQFRSKPLTGEGVSPASCYLSPVLAPILLSIGMFFIFLDLTRKLNSFWFYLNFNPMSPMSWGAWGVGAIIPVSVLWALASIPEQYRHYLKWPKLQDFSFKLSAYRNKLAVANFALGIFLGIYTGVLLSGFVARPLWNSALLPILFLNGGLSTGAALLVLIARDPKEKLFFTKADIALITSEIVVIILFFYGQLTSTAPHVDAIAPFFTTGYYFPFWIAVFTLGIGLPLALVLDVMEVAGFAKIRVHLSAWFVLIGGLVIRLALVYVGQLSSLSDIVHR